MTVCLALGWVGNRASPQPPPTPADVKVLWTSDYTTTPATQTWSSSGAEVGGPPLVSRVTFPSTGLAHLHFEVRTGVDEDTARLNPHDWLALPCGARK